MSCAARRPRPAGLPLLAVWAVCWCAGGSSHASPPAPAAGAGRPASSAASASALAGWQDLVRTQIARHLEKVWGAPVSFQSLDVGLTPPRLTLRGLECATRMGGFKAALRAGSLSATPALGSLLLGSVEWEEIEAADLEIELGPITDPAPAEAPAPASPLIARRLQVSRAAVTLRSGALLLRARLALEGSVVGSDSGLAGSLRLEELAVDGVKGVQGEVRLQGKGGWTWTPAGLEISGLEMQGEFAKATLDARLAARDTSFKFDSTLDVARLPWTPPLDLTLGGEWKLAGTVALEGSGWQGSGTLRAGILRFRDLALDVRAPARWAITPAQAEISGLEVGLQGGTLRMTGRALAPAFDAVHLKVEARDLPASLASRLWPQAAALQGLVSGRLEGRTPFPGSLDSLRADGSVRLAPDPAAAWPLSAQGRFGIEAGSLNASADWSLGELGGALELREGRARVHLAEIPLRALYPWVERALEHPLPEGAAGLEGNLSAQVELKTDDPLSSWRATFPVRGLSYKGYAVGAALVRGRAEGGRWLGEIVPEEGSAPPPGAGDAAGAPGVQGDFLLRWEMEAGRVETLRADILADVAPAALPGVRLGVAGEVRASAPSWLSASIEAPALAATARLYLERSGGAWTGWLHADDGAEGWADVQARFDASGLAAASGQVGRWRLGRGSADEPLAGFLADLVEMSILWEPSSAQPLARLRLLERRADGGTDEWGAGEARWGEGALGLVLSRSSPPLRLDASLTTARDWPFTIDLRAPPAQVEMAPGARLETTLGGSVEVRGRLRPWEWSAEIDLQRLAIVSEGREWLASGAVRGTGSAAGWRLDPVRLAGEAGALDVQVDPGSGELHARGSLSVAPLARWVAEADVAGNVEVDVRWAPGAGSRGTLRLSGVRLASGVLPFSVDDVRGVARLEPGRILLEAVEGSAGEGSVHLSGQVPLPGSAHAWALALEARGVPLRQPPGLNGVGDASLRLEGEGALPLVAGKVDLHQGVYTLPVELTGGSTPPLLLDFSGDVPLAFAGVKLAVALRVQHLWLRSEYTRIECQGALDLSGSVAQPVLRGRLAAIEGGEVRFSDTRYRVVSGLMEFPGAASFYPRVDLRAETERADYLVHLEVRGTPDDLRVGLRSDPPLPTAEIVRLLTTGRIEQAPGGLPGGAAGDLLGGMVGGLAVAPLESGLQTLIPVDTLDIDPMAVSSQGDPTARITLGKRLSRRVTLSYSSNLADNQEELYQLRYRLQSELEAITSREDDGSIGGDLRYSRRLYPPKARPPASAEDKHPVVRRIRFHGDSPFSARRLRRALNLAPGETASSFDLFDSQERLWRLHARAGNPQAVIEASLRPRRAGSADVVFEIRAGRRLEVRLEGAALSRALEESLLELWQDPDLRSLVAARAEQRITEHLRAQGYPSARARFAGTDAEPDRDVWGFEVTSGRRVEIESLRFKRRSRIDEKDLLGAIQSRADFPGERGTFVLSRLRADTRALAALYASRGFRDAKVELEPPRLSSDGRKARVSWRIEEGPLYQVEAVRVEPESAALLLPPVTDVLQLRAQAAFSERALARDTERLRAEMDRLGYSEAAVRPRLEGDPEALRIVFEVDPGARRLVGEIVLGGNLLTREQVIRRELGFGTGEPLSERALSQAERNLYQLGVFRSVSVAPGQAADGQDGVPVLVQVLESPPLTVGATVGYDSDDRFRGRLDLSNRNLFGTRLYAGGVARAGSSERRVQALLRDPRLFNTRLAGLASAFYEEEERDTFDAQRRGGHLQIEHRPGSRVTLFYRYTLSEVDLSDVSLTAEDVEPELRLAHLGWSLAYDSRNDFVDPRTGLFGSLDLKWFSRGLASQAEFARVFLQASFYRPLSARMVWATGVRAGYARPLGEDSLVPISERFFAGGESSVRGFERDRLGPIDSVSEDPLGGELSLVLNQEVRFPIWRLLRGVAFYDGGNVFGQPQDFQARELRHVLGLGIRLDTPIGPMRLDYGRVLDRKDGEDPGRLHLSIGHAF